MAKQTIPQDFKVLELLQPATDAAGRTSPYFSMKGVRRATIIVHITQGNAATIALSLLQATAVAGTGSKAVANAVPVWSNLDTAAGEDLVRRTDAVSYTTDAAVKNKIAVFEIDGEDLDVAGGYDSLAISTGASNVANLTQAVAILHAKYPQATPPAVKVD